MEQAKEQEILTTERTEYYQNQDLSYKVNLSSLYFENFRAVGMHHLQLHQQFPSDYWEKKSPEDHCNMPFLSS